MVTNSEDKTKKKKNKIRPYDVDESKKVFLFAYEYQLRNEKINWKKAEELKITKHSAGSMRSHYMNKIKNEVSLYLEMYPEEVSKLFANAKKMKRMKKPEQTKNLSIINNFAKQTSNISLNRLTKCGSIGAGFNKMNSLSIDKMFSSTYGKNKKKGRIMLGTLGEERPHKRRKENDEKEKTTGEKTDNTATNINEINEKDKEKRKNDKTHVEAKEKKINKNKKKKKKREKDIILKSSLVKTHKTLATQFPKKLIEKKLQEEEEEKEEEEKKKREKGSIETEKDISKNDENITKTEDFKEKESNDSIIFPDNKEETTKMAQTKIKTKKNIKKEMRDKNHVLLNSIQNTEKKPLNSLEKTSESAVINNVCKEEKKGAIASIFSYIFKKIFH